MARKTQRVVFNNQAREIIAKVYDFMKKEAINNYAAKLTDARWRSSQAVGVSERTITRILRERKTPVSPAAESNLAQLCEVSSEPMPPQHDIEVSIEHKNEITTLQSDMPSTITSVSAPIKTPMIRKKAGTKKKKIGQIRSKGSQKDYSDLPVNIDSQH